MSNTTSNELTKEQLDELGTRILNDNVNSFKNINKDEFNKLSETQKKELQKYLEDSLSGITLTMEKSGFTLAKPGVGGRNRRKSRKTKKVRKGKKRAYSRRR